MISEITAFQQQNQNAIHIPEKQSVEKPFHISIENLPYALQCLETKFITEITDSVPAPSYSAMIAFDKASESILLVHIPSGPEKKLVYTIPGGKIEENETPLAAAKRELLEAAGVHIPKDSEN